jgi:hypothetical protein
MTDLRRPRHPACAGNGGKPVFPMLSRVGRRQWVTGTELRDPWVSCPRTSSLRDSGAAAHGQVMDGDDEIRNFLDPLHAVVGFHQVEVHPGGHTGP